jgi:hypothetical protein
MAVVNTFNILPQLQYNFILLPYLKITSPAGRTRRSRHRTPTRLPASKKHLQLTWQKKALAVGEVGTTTHIRKLKSTLTKYIPDATTNWTPSSKVTLAEFFEEYQEQMRQYINESVVASANRLRMVQDQQNVINTILKDAIQHLDHDASIMQQQIQLQLFD